ncbi:diacylglycerol kinase theta-like isoform X1 [Acropora muricata]|uniref:diacylglycerol kinase theta-like isoform X1 n=1 Tax=Acropora muricata TaxID=159855 RepID=UPI0034E4B84C
MSYLSRDDLATVHRCLSDSKLDEAFSAHGQSGHRFDWKTFTRPTYCNHCTNLLWGLTNQGLVCEVCNFVSHERCMLLVVTPCISIATSLVQEPVSHTWSGPSFYRKRFCSVCRKRLDEHTAFRCQVCDYFVHEECKGFSVSDCKNCATYLPTKQKQCIQQSHHWREGNLSPNAKCAYCKRGCGTVESLASMKCSWCGQSAHSSCHLMLPKECGFGYLHKLVLPPYAVSMSNITLWSSCSHRRSSRASTIGNYDDSHDGLVVDDSPENNKDPSHSVDSAETVLKIYDGEVSDPKLCKNITIPRTAQASNVLEEALKKFHITDNPSNYYLAKAVNQETERPLDPEEKPHQFAENSSSKPLIFLRMKSADRRKGYIRVYPGMINVTSMFKTIPVTAVTTVSEIINVALEKFGLKGASPEDYTLTEVHLNEGVQERRMDKSDCPWKILLNIRKKSVRKMKLSRFYLRQNLEPLGEVSLCVGSLPTGLESSKYGTLITDMLGKSAEFCKVQSVFPSFGMVFLSFPAADVAADAVETLKMSTVDGKELYTKVLPNIHPHLFSRQSQPLLVFVNSRSGGGQGADMLAAFQRLLNPHQVYALSDGGPLPGLYAFRSVPDFRMLICGGDGTVGWVLSCLDDVLQDLKCKMPASAVLPLGTGNDLSRVLKWGGGYSGGESPVSLLMAIDQAQEVLLDRWCIMFDSPEGVPNTPSNDSAFGSVEEPSIFTMNNYFGIGIGAELCLDFHLQREESPDKFHSRLHNKGVYLRAGLKKMVKGCSKKFFHEVEIEVDGNKVDFPSLEGIVILNIGSWGAGTDLWGPDKDDGFTPTNQCDGLVEIVGLQGIMHLGQIQSGIKSGIRLAQGAQINITLKSEMPVQIDGEPWMQAPGKVIVRPTLTQAVMLTKTKAKLKNTRALTPSHQSSRSSSIFYKDWT